MSADTFNSDEIALVARCREESIALLRANSPPEGLLAASLSEDAERRRYCNLFARDAAICALGMVVAGDDALRDTARASLLTLARHQADNGQIPNFVDVLKQEPDFWYVGCIDATLWWLVAVRFCSTHLRDDGLRTTLHPHIERALHWLRCQEHPRLCLLQQNEASDWADIMPRSGFVLYTNALWYYVKCLYDLPHRDDTRINFNHLFYPYSNAVPDERRLRILMQYVRAGTQRDELYLSFVNFAFWGEEGDLFGNLLACLLGLADEVRTQAILRTIEHLHADTPHPLRVTERPIARDDVLWRPYMARHRQNLDYQYHNGGIWPYVGGFWVLALAAQGQRDAAQRALARLAEANRAESWGFHEWFHGETGEARGMRGQSWNAGMFLLAEWGLSHTVF